MTSPDPAAPVRSVLERRRASAFAALGDGVLVLPAAPIQHSSRDTERPYAPDRELFYLTGATEPGTVAVLCGGGEPRFVLFVRERDSEAELWAGPRLGPGGASERFGPTECHPLSELSERLPDLLRAGDRVHYRLGRGGPVEAMVLDALAFARARGSRKGVGPRGVVDPGEILDDLRLVKDASEVSALREAARITLLGHRLGAAAVAPGVGEWEVEAAVDGGFRAAGATGSGFDTIVGSGPNACVLHYVDNADTIAAGDLVLVDAGAEVGLYHGDVTRTYPASGRFTGPQREVYEAVDAARRAAIDAVAPGAAVVDVHMAAVRALTEGLIAMDVLQGSVDDLVEAEAHKAYFPHQTSHWLGLDVHDPGDYARNGASRALEPGMVLTVEPGLYFGPAATDEAAGRLRGIGVRIEDDVLVTESGCEVLTAALPTAADEVESLVAQRA